MREPVLIRDMKPYLAGLIDSDGSIKCVVRKRKRRNKQWSLLPEVHFYQYFAGLLDGDGGMAQKIIRSKGAKNGFLFALNVYVSATACENLTKFFESAQEKFGIHFSKAIYKTKNVTMLDWYVCRRDEVKKLLQNIFPYLIIKKEQARIILEEIIPRMEEGLHLTKEGMIEIMYYADLLSALHKKGKRKYSQRYFKDLWGL